MQFFKNNNHNVKLWSRWNICVSFDWNCLYKIIFDFLIKDAVKNVGGFLVSICCLCVLWSANFLVNSSSRIVKIWNITWKSNGFYRLFFFSFHSFAFHSIHTHIQRGILIFCFHKFYIALLAHSSLTLIKFSGPFAVKTFHYVCVSRFFFV